MRNINTQEKIRPIMDPFTTSPMENTPMTKAIWSQMYCVVRKLIEIGEDVNKADGWGYTPLIAAYSVRRDDILKVLI